MGLSTRLIVLGVSGPLVSMAIFFLISSMTALRLSREAGHDITKLIDQDNLTRVRTATRLIQSSADQTADDLSDDSKRLAESLQDLGMDPDGGFRWKGQPLSREAAQQVVINALRLGLATPNKSASVYYTREGKSWIRLAGVTDKNTTLPALWRVPDTTAKQLESLDLTPSGTLLTQSTLVREDHGWRLSELTALGPDPVPARLVLSVSVRTDAASSLLETATNLFPQADHQLAFLGLSASNRPICLYSQPGQAACQVLIKDLQATGGLPTVSGSGDPYLMERRSAATGDSRTVGEERTLFISVFPAWDWISVMSVDNKALLKSLRPLQSDTFRILVQLSAVTLALIGFCGLAAWRISEGIRQQLRELAAAATAISNGQRRQAISYAGNDSLGRLVQAFNSMAGAVAEREDSLLAKIRTLEIDINQEELHGQICSIVKDPNFTRLNQRARAMRARRNRALDPL
jgi:HAMP domain-containing protein